MHMVVDFRTSQGNSQIDHELHVCSSFGNSRTIVSIQNSPPQRDARHKTYERLPKQQKNQSFLSTDVQGFL